MQRWQHCGLYGAIPVKLTPVKAKTWGSSMCVHHFPSVHCFQLTSVRNGIYMFLGYCDGWYKQRPWRKAKLLWKGSKLWQKASTFIWTIWLGYPSHLILNKSGTVKGIENLLKRHVVTEKRGLHRKIVKRYCLK